MQQEKSSVRVVVRVRPMDKVELAAESKNVLEVDKINRAITLIKPNATLNEPKKTYYFDNVFDAESSQLDVYVDTAHPIVEKVLEGYNGTILAYGQTGTGKTYSMFGKADMPQTKGIIPNAFAHIFGHIAKAKENQKFLVRVSYMEIYNEKVHDLLCKDVNKSLEVKERPGIGVFVKDLTSYIVHNEDDLENIMEEGTKNRAVGATKMNLESSRSHAIFSITIELVDVGTSHVRIGKLQLVDLAGSERQSKTHSTGERLKEANQINLSLSTLSNVISALVDVKCTHIPYRNSKLTRILQDSLGGNSKTVMCATINPADSNYLETISTLRFASQAKEVENLMHINEHPKNAVLSYYEEEIARLRKQLEEGSFEDQLSIEEEDDDDDDDAEIKTEVEEPIAKNAVTNVDKKSKRIQGKSDVEKEIENAKLEQEQLRSKLMLLESKILVGGENLLEKAKIQEELLEQSIAEIEMRKKAEEELHKKLQKKRTDFIDIEERYSSLQEESAGLTKKLQRVIPMLMGVKSELADQQREHQREKEGIYGNIRSLSRELGLCELVRNSYIPKEYQPVIDQSVHWNEDIGEWLLKGAAHTGNNMLKHIADSKSNSKESDEFIDLSDVSLSNNTDSVTNPVRAKSASQRKSRIPIPITKRRY